MSDLHLEFGLLQHPIIAPEADVCVVAGDVLTKGILPSLMWLDENIAHLMPVVFVAGNHEFYHDFFQNSLEAASRFRGSNRLHFLEDASVEIDNVVFMGATLWTDFDVLGEGWSEHAMRRAAEAMGDYKLVKYQKNPFMGLRPAHTFQKHARSRRFLEKSLALSADKKAVVVTHHAPSIRSVEERYVNDLLTPSYASNLESLMSGIGSPALWIHGHIHHKADYRFDATRVICNPRGYPRERCHEDFDFGLVVEV